MLRNLSVNFNRKFQDKDDRPRKSSDNQCISPLSDQHETVGYRYYRSAEFQQALGHKDDDYTSLFDFGDAHEDACRRTRYERRKSVIMTKIPFLHPEQGTEEDREAASSPRASGRNRWSSYTSGTSVTSSSRQSIENEADLTKSEKKNKRASVLMEGFDQFVAFAKHKRPE